MPPGIEAELKAGEKKRYKLIVAQLYSVCNCATYNTFSIVPTSGGGGDGDYPPTRRVGSYPP